MDREHSPKIMGRDSQKPGLLWQEVHGGNSNEGDVVEGARVGSITW